MDYECRYFWDIKVNEEIKHCHHNGISYIKRITLKDGIEHVDYLPHYGKEENK